MLVLFSAAKTVKKSSETRVNFVTNLLWPRGRLDEALRQLQTAEKADPLSPTIQFEYGELLISAGRYKEASTHCAKSSDIAECQGRVFLAELSGRDQV